MIVSFRHKGLRRLYESGDGKGLPPEMLVRIETVLAALDQAEAIEDLDRPSFRLHALKGDRAGTWAVMVRANWRVVFRFEEGDVFDVDFIDYQ